MSTKYTIEVSITPLCTSCGSELNVGFTKGKPTNHPFDRDNPLERTDRFVYIEACEKCFAHKSVVPAASDRPAPAHTAGQEAK